MAEIAYVLVAVVCGFMIGFVVALKVVQSDIQMLELRSGGLPWRENVSMKDERLGADAKIAGMIEGIIQTWCAAAGKDPVTWGPGIRKLLRELVDKSLVTAR